MKYLRWSYCSCIALALLCVSCGGETPPLSDAEYLARWKQTQNDSSEKLSGTGGEWHFDFQTVRAYRLNWDDEFSMRSILSGGQLNETRIPQHGIPLSIAQVKRLRNAVTGSHPDRGIGLCIYPHHAFLFFDESDQVVGCIDVCLLCHHFRGTPKGYANRWDLLAVAELLHDLGLPLSNPEWK